MELTMIIITTFLVLSERPLMVDAGGGRILDNGYNMKDELIKKMTTDSLCIKNHFPPRKNQNSGTNTKIEHKLDQLSGDGKSLVCLAAYSDTTNQAQFAIAYNIEDKIPVMTFKSFHCPSKKGCPLYHTAFTAPDFLNNDIDGVVTRQGDIKGDLPAFSLGKRGAIHGIDRIERGHLLSRELGAGLAKSMEKSKRPTAGMEATYNMVNVIPQFKNSNQHGVWRSLEKSAVEKVESCYGTFYLVTGIKESTNYREYACGDKHQVTYEGKKTRFFMENCVVRHRKKSGCKRPKGFNLSFPEKMWIAGCCISESNIQIYYGEATNDYNKIIRSKGELHQYGDGFTESFKDFNVETGHLFKDTVCYKE